MILPCSCKPQRIMTFEIYHCHFKKHPHLCVQSAMLGFILRVTKVLPSRNYTIKIQTDPPTITNWINAIMAFALPQSISTAAHIYFTVRGSAPLIRCTWSHGPLSQSPAQGTTLTMKGGSFSCWLVGYMAAVIFKFPRAVSLVLLISASYRACIQ